MCYCDKNKVELFIGDIVEKDGQKYTVRLIESYPCATVAIAENIVTNSIDTLFLGDIIKILPSIIK